ncbi:MAG TPA: tetratricopeptide repeat protein [Polyangiaceae bacterium]|nr:tetratricopeptide repeat protein [Polyangiaceae bacterium]
MLLRPVLLLALATGCGGSDPPSKSPDSLGDLGDKSRPELETSCEHGEGRACFELARRYREGIDVGKSDETAYGWLKLSCDLDVKLGCNQAGWAALHGRGTARQPELAGRYFARACPSGEEEAIACDSRAFALLTGLGHTRVDVREAARIYERVCRAGVPHGCLALTILEKQGLDAGHARAIETEVIACSLDAEKLERACTVEPDPQYCLLSAMMFRTGTCTSQQEGRARQLFERARPFQVAWPNVAESR